MVNHFYGIELDEFIIMPNHIHGIIWNVGAGFPRPQGGSAIQGAETAPLRKITLGQIIAYFKYRSSKMINELQKMPGQAIWQRNYYERIIRNDNELNRIRQYIQDNPINWAFDPENL